MAWFRPSRSNPAVAEAAAPTVNTPAPQGFVYGIPRGGTTEYNQGITNSASSDRRSMLEELYQSYLTCPWSAACVDVIARTITAGGVEVVWDGGADSEQEDAPDAPEQVAALRALLQYVNPREDIRQLMRGVIGDLLVFGDAFLEVVWLGDTPLALYSLDCPTMAVIADEHGTVQKYVQATDTGQRAEFEPREVIHISMDAPRTGLYGVAATQKVLLPITVWLFTAATLKEVMRKGDPVAVHVDFPADKQPNEIKLWRQQYMVENIGPRNVGTPITTKGGATVTELKAYAVENYLKTLDQKRDEILSGYGVPPSKVGVIESGNLGGGTGTSQDKTFRVNTCAPVDAAVMEKLVFHLAREAFGVPDDWTMRFGDFDWRDDKVVDDISSQRMRDGRWTLNRSRAEIGEPPVDGGDDPVLVDRQNLVLWSDMSAMSKAMVTKTAGPPAAPAAAGGHQGEPPGVAAPDQLPAGGETASARLRVSEGWAQMYRTEVARVLAQLGGDSD